MLSGCVIDGIEGVKRQSDDQRGATLTNPRAGAALLSTRGSRSSRLTVTRTSRHRARRCNQSRYCPYPKRLTLIRLARPGGVPRRGDGLRSASPSASTRSRLRGRATARSYLATHAQVLDAAGSSHLLLFCGEWPALDVGSMCQCWATSRSRFLP